MRFGSGPVRLRLAVVVLSSALLTLSLAGQSRDSLPASLTDAEFWSLTRAALRAGRLLPIELGLARQSALERKHGVDGRRARSPRASSRAACISASVPSRTSRTSRRCGRASRSSPTSAAATCTCTCCTRRCSRCRRIAPTSSARLFSAQAAGRVSPRRRPLPRSDERLPARRPGRRGGVRREPEAVIDHLTKTPALAARRRRRRRHRIRVSQLPPLRARD